jgi:hypothetical protein
MSFLWTLGYLTYQLHHQYQDSFRLFCCVLAGESDWKNVMPLDKELRVYAVCIIPMESEYLTDERTEMAVGGNRVCLGCRTRRGRTCE